MAKTLALTVVALGLWAATPLHAQTATDTARQNAAEAGGSAGTISGSNPNQSSRSTQVPRASGAGGSVTTRDTIGNIPPGDRTGAGGGAR